MKYMLLIYSAESGWNEPEREACMLTSLGVCEELAAQGKFIAASPLHSVMTATSVRVRDGKPLITDGPFAETTEQLGGYYVIDVDNLDEAIAVAGRLPPAAKGTVEIRPIFDVSGLQQRNTCEIVTRRDLPYSRAQVYAAFADPQRLARWWGPDWFTNTIQHFDFRPGGEWRFIMHGPDGKNYDNHIIFESLVAPAQIAFHHVSAPRFHTTISLIELSPTATHFHWVMQFETPEVRESLASLCIPANEQNLDRLIAELRRSDDE
ncbi:MAG: SRPBCC domain-containing protein [Planctomycetaceae bacterium]|nr:SRPBCC domain-containing protein [Planctomycetaceae bacterium]